MLPAFEGVSIFGMSTPPFHEIVHIIIYDHFMMVQRMNLLYFSLKVAHILSFQEAMMREYVESKKFYPSA